MIVLGMMQGTKLIKCHMIIMMVRMIEPDARTIPLVTGPDTSVCFQGLT